MDLRIHDIRISAISVFVPVSLLLFLAIGLTASAILLNYMAGVRTAAVSAADPTSIVVSLDMLNRLLTFASALFAVFLSLFAGFFIWFTRIRLLAPLNELKAAMGRLAEGDMTFDVPRQTQKDEIGAMARALQVFKRNAVELDGLSVISRNRC